MVVEINGARKEAALPGRQGRLLFAILVLNRHRLMPRSEVIDSLWPDDVAATADSSPECLDIAIAKGDRPNSDRGSWNRSHDHRRQRRCRY